MKERFPKKDLEKEFSNLIKKIQYLVYNPQKLEEIESLNFRNEKWFKNLDEEEKAKIEYEIALQAHYIVQRFLENKTEEFMKKLPDELKNFFILNRATRVAYSLIFKPDKRLKDEFLKVIEEYKKEFGSLPGDCYTLEVNCSNYVSCLGKILSKLCYPVGTITLPGHIVLFFRIKDKEYVADISKALIHPYDKWLEIEAKVEEEEIEEIEKTIRKPKSYEFGVLSNFVPFLFDLEEYDKAIEESKKLIEMSPNYWQPHRLLAEIFKKLGRYEDAIKEYEITLKLNPPPMFKDLIEESLKELKKNKNIKK
ncbi:MAG: tetratricopeptide repeat protein [Minisyncoccia bacterium]